MPEPKPPPLAIFIITFILVGIGLPPAGIAVLLRDIITIPMSNAAPLLVTMIIIGIALRIAYSTWETGGIFIFLGVLAFGFLNFVGCSKNLHSLSSMT